MNSLDSAIKVLQLKVKKGNATEGERQRLEKLIIHRMIKE